MFSRVGKSRKNNARQLSIVTLGAFTHPAEFVGENHENLAANLYIRQKTYWTEAPCWQDVETHPLDLFTHLGGTGREPTPDLALYWICRQNAMCKHFAYKFNREPTPDSALCNSQQDVWTNPVL